MNESSLREFYEHVYPTKLIVSWLSYNLEDFGVSATELQDAGDELAETPAGHVSGSTADSPVKSAAATRAEASKQALKRSAHESYFARREFCFTLIGDIFTRFRCYTDADELRAALVASCPEKIDAGAVYNVRPNQKSAAMKFEPLERELVFDIDMSDYDNVRSCCTGKSICTHCWPWMSCAARVLSAVLEEDFGFKYILPVFSGRRGVHVWVCDKRARALHNDERAAIVGYLTVVMPKTLRSSTVADLANHRRIHPTIRSVLTRFIERSFVELFVTSDESNPNNMQYHPAAAAIVHDAILSVLKLGRRDQLTRFVQAVNYTDGQPLRWEDVLRALGTERDARDVLHAAQLLLMYPRLDEKVSTDRGHLLKLPFCVHPGTTSLCCPLTWDGIDTFNPTEDAPKLDEILLDRGYDSKWEAPLRRMLSAMRNDREEYA